MNEQSVSYGCFDIYIHKKVHVVYEGMDVAFFLCTLLALLLLLFYFLLFFNRVAFLGICFFFGG
jgi:hypothetical protein